ncbi:MAG TPA: TolC family protein, partial [Lacipirellulaceae bacterium]|nr:TolC family protein [Lacipirellulaceae bacterium]
MALRSSMESNLRISACGLAIVLGVAGCASQRPVSRQNVSPLDNNSAVTVPPEFHPLPTAVTSPAKNDSESRFEAAHTNAPAASVPAARPDRLPPLETSKLQTALPAQAATARPPRAPFDATENAASSDRAQLTSATTIAAIDPAASKLQNPEEIPTPIAPTNQCRMDMSTALALVAGQNPQVGFAQSQIREAYADVERANVLWLPSIQSGVSYHHHEGTLQDSGGTILDNSQSSLEAGLGAGAVGAGTTTLPGIVAQFQLVDAIFQPEIARRAAAAQVHGRDSVLNDQLLEAAIAYQELLRAYQQQAVAADTVAHIEQLVHLTTDYAKTGEGTQADADRSQTELAIRRNNLARSDEGVAVASARLAQVLSLDGTQQIRPIEDNVTPINLVPLSHTRQENLATALANRPELMQSRDLVAAAVE